MAPPNQVGIIHELLQDEAVAFALNTAASIVGLSTETASKIFQAGLSALALSAQRHPDLFTVWYARSVGMLPVDVRELYQQLPRQRARQAALITDFQRTYGEAAARGIAIAATSAGVVDDDAATVMATAMPALNHAIARAIDGTGEAGMMAWLKSVSRAYGL